MAEHDNGPSGSSGGASAVPSERVPDEKKVHLRRELGLVKGEIKWRDAPWQVFITVPEETLFTCLFIDFILANACMHNA